MEECCIHHSNEIVDNTPPSRLIDALSDSHYYLSYTIFIQNINKAVSSRCQELTGSQIENADACLELIT